MGVGGGGGGGARNRIIYVGSGRKMVVRHRETWKL